MSTREPCGCKSNERMWTNMCDAHRAEFEATHARWQAEHVERQQAKNTERPS